MAVYKDVETECRVNKVLCERRDCTMALSKKKGGWHFHGLVVTEQPIHKGAVVFEQRKCDGGDRYVTFLDLEAVTSGSVSFFSSSLSSIVWASVLVAVASSMPTA
jgi:hypothetical protein